MSPLHTVGFRRAAGDYWILRFLTENTPCCTLHTISSIKSSHLTTRSSPGPWPCAWPGGVRGSGVTSRWGQVSWWTGAGSVEGTAPPVPCRRPSPGGRPPSPPAPPPAARARRCGGRCARTPGPGRPSTRQDHITSVIIPLTHTISMISHLNSAEQC